VRQGPEAASENAEMPEPKSRKQDRKNLSIFHNEAEISPTRTMRTRLEICLCELYTSGFEQDPKRMIRTVST
jgi:hypothetical protein